MGTDRQPRHTWVAHTGILVILLVIIALVTPSIRHSLLQLLQTLGGFTGTPAPHPTRGADLAGFRDRFAHLSEDDSSGASAAARSSEFPVSCDNCRKHTPRRIQADEQ
jgi:hypothetical protein